MYRLRTCSKHAPPMDSISRIRFRPLAGAPRSVSSDCNLVGFRAGDYEKEKLVVGADGRWWYRTDNSRKWRGQPVQRRQDFASTLDRVWKQFPVAALVNQAVVRLGSLSSDRGNDTMSVQNTLVKVHVNRWGKVITQTSKSNFMASLILYRPVFYPGRSADMTFGIPPQKNLFFL